MWGRPFVFESSEHLLNAIDVVGIANSQDIPSIRNGIVSGTSSVNAIRVSPSMSDVVVVVNPAQVVEAQMSGE